MKRALIVIQWQSTILNQKLTGVQIHELVFSLYVSIMEIYTSVSVVILKADHNSPTNSQ